MAIAAAAIAAVGVVWSGVAAGKRAREGRLMAAKAQEKIDNFEHQELYNAYDEVGVSRMGADLRREEMGRSMATSVQALRSGGVRGVVGGIGQLNAQNQYNNAMIAADLDRQNKELNRLRAQEDARILSIKENREIQELGGYGQMLNVGLQTKWQGQAGVANAVQSGTSIAGNYMSGGYGATGWGNGAVGAGKNATPYVAPATTYTQPMTTMNGFGGPIQTPLYTGS